VAIVPFQAFADSSRGGIVERRTMHAEPNVSCGICSSIWQQSVALFNELREQKLINNFNYCLQQH